MTKTEIEKPPMSPYGEFLGIEIVEFSAGKATCSIELKDHHLNNGGRVHGGVLTSLADTAAGVAVRSVRPEGKLSATTDLSISFIRPPRGNSLLAVAEVIHAGRQLFRCEIAIYCEDKLVAKTTATFMLVEPLNK
ncbi:MAG: PaaI family thioesterase [Proteobacteria bacterium]|nr:PaaI family thioesterase [Pseudomonadota bacterium]